MVAWRHHLHQIPETAYDEFNTSQFIQRTLDSLSIPWQLVGLTGILGTIQGRRPGPSIMLRADMDALRIEEATGATYSAANGCMHACGHDGHMAIVLGVASEFVAKDLAGNLHVLFTPAEEAGAGCQMVRDQPEFQAVPVDMILALHGWPELPLGTIGIGTGVMMSGDDSFVFTIVGESGHGAMPEKAVNPVTRIGALTEALSRLALASRGGIVTPTCVVGGHDFNVIPESVELRGTMRFQDADMRARMRVSMENLRIEGVALQLRWVPGYPPTINDAALARQCSDVVRATDGLTVQTVTVPSMATEDFSYLAQRFSTCYAWLGMGEQTRRTRGLHSNAFDFNDAALLVGFDYFSAILAHHLLT